MWKHNCIFLETDRVKLNHDRGLNAYICQKLHFPIKHFYVIFYLYICLHSNIADLLKMSFFVQLLR
jgi:hypothetical protein